LFWYEFSAATLLILRKQKTGEANVGKGFMKKITPLLCVLFVIAYIVVATAVVIDKPKAALTG
jgi:preprotein translocase subunit SecG